MKPNNFITSSDFATLKNDAQGNTITVQLAAGTLFNPTAPILATATVKAGTINAGLRARGFSSKYGRWVPGLTIYSDLLIDIPSQPSIPAYATGLYCTLDRVSPDTVRLRAGVDGVSGTPPNFRVLENQTITFVFSTSLSPFPAN